MIKAHQKLKKTSVKVSAQVNSANTIQYIIHFTWKRRGYDLNSFHSRLLFLKLNKVEVEIFELEIEKLIFQFRNYSNEVLIKFILTYSFTFFVLTAL